MIFKADTSHLLMQGMGLLVVLRLEREMELTISQIIRSIHVPKPCQLHLKGICLIADKNNNNKPGINNPGDSTNTALKAVKIKSAKSKAKKTVVVKWKKRKGVDGYQISYAKNKKFKKAKTIKVKAKKVSYKIKKLKSGKKYFVKIRAYKRNGNEMITGAWSKVKVVKKVK